MGLASNKKRKLTITIVESEEKGDFDIDISGNYSPEIFEIFGLIEVLKFKMINGDGTE